MGLQPFCFCAGGREGAVLALLRVRAVPLGSWGDPQAAGGQR